MAYRIISPEFSFVRFSDQHLDDANWLESMLPGAELGFILPANHPNDFAYQFIVEADTEAEIDDVCNSNGGPAGAASMVVYPGGALPETISLSEWNTITGTYTADEVIAGMGGSRIRISATQVFFYVPSIPLPTDGTIGCGDCFQLIFAPNNIFDYGFFVSNVFNYQCDNTDYTSVIDYYSELDEAGFLYCIAPTVKNRARLPIYLTRPTYPDVEESYRLSNGRYKTSKSQVRKIYEVITDNFPVWVIECLRAVFIHDSVFIEDEPTLPQTMPYQGEIVKEGAFDPQYVPYQNFPLANVAFKVVAVDYGLSKNNCGECTDYSDTMTVTDGTVGTAAPGTVYNVDLSALVDTCCSPTAYSVYFIDARKVASAIIAGTIVTITTKNPFLAGPPPVAFVRIQVSCAGIIKYLDITG